eukprot:INCI16305.1.p1 GENE.INCI16305.1~~INCI16305.1.p1  ORF type:complete len:989 (-),score=147.34 INCI16305.1:1677-4643(-)
MAQILKTLAQPLVGLVDWSQGASRLREFGEDVVPRAWARIVLNEVVPLAEAFGLLVIDLTRELVLGGRLFEPSVVLRKWTRGDGSIDWWHAAGVLAALYVIVVPALSLLYAVWRVYRSLSRDTGVLTRIDNQSQLGVASEGASVETNTDAATLPAASLTSPDKLAFNESGGSAGPNGLVSSDAGQLQLPTDELVGALQALSASAKPAERLHVWDELIDEASNCPYFFNIQNGDSQWELPSLKLRHRWVRRFDKNSPVMVAHAATGGDAYYFDNDSIPGVIIRDYRDLARIHSPADAAPYMPAGNKLEVEEPQQSDHDEGSGTGSRGREEGTSRGVQAVDIDGNRAESLKQISPGLPNGCEEGQRTETSFWISRAFFVQAVALLQLFRFADHLNFGDVVFSTPSEVDATDVGGFFEYEFATPTPALSRFIESFGASRSAPLSSRQQVFPQVQGSVDAAHDAEQAYAAWACAEGDASQCENVLGAGSFDKEGSNFGSSLLSPELANTFGSDASFLSVLAWTASLPRPTLAVFSAQDFLLTGPWIGILAAIVVVSGLGANKFVLLVTWGIHLSLANVLPSMVETDFDLLLLEAGFLAITVAPTWSFVSWFGRSSSPPPLGVWLCRFFLFRWLLFTGLRSLLSQKVYARYCGSGIEGEATSTGHPMAVPEPGATSASGDDSNLTFGDSNGRASAGAHKQSFNLDNAIEMICRNGGLRDLEFLVAAASSGSVGPLQLGVDTRAIKPSWAALLNLFLPSHVRSAWALTAIIGHLALCLGFSWLLLLPTHVATRWVGTATILVHVGFFALGFGAHYGVVAILATVCIDDGAWKTVKQAVFGRSAMLMVVDGTATADNLNATLGRGSLRQKTSLPMRCAGNTMFFLAEWIRSWRSLTRHLLHSALHVHSYHRRAILAVRLPSLRMMKRQPPSACFHQPKELPHLTSHSACQKMEQAEESFAAGGRMTQRVPNVLWPSLLRLSWLGSPQLAPRFLNP